MDLLTFMMAALLCLVMFTVSWCIYSFTREFRQRRFRKRTPSTPQELIARQSDRKRSTRRTKNRLNKLINWIKPSYLSRFRLRLPITTTWLGCSLLFLFVLSILVTLQDPAPKNRTPFSYSLYKTEYNYKISEDDARGAVQYVNEIRGRYGRSEIAFDERVYGLAIARATDMRQRNYYDHTSPTGDCPDKMKATYGFSPDEYVAENIIGSAEYSEEPLTKIEVKPVTDAIDAWMDSRGHRYNLLYDEHIAGAVGCYKNMCVFLGLNHNRFGKGCYKAAETLKEWETAPREPGEVEYP